MKRRGRVPATYSAPANPPECEPCAENMKIVATRPHEIPVDELARIYRLLEQGFTPGKKVKAATPVGGWVWACPFHTPRMVRMVGRNRKGQSVSWKIEAA